MELIFKMEEQLLAKLQTELNCLKQEKALLERFYSFGVTVLIRCGVITDSSDKRHLQLDYSFGFCFPAMRRFHVNCLLRNLLAD